MDESKNAKAKFSVKGLKMLDKSQRKEGRELPSPIFSTEALQVALTHTFKVLMYASDTAFYCNDKQLLESASRLYWQVVMVEEGICRVLFSNSYFFDLHLKCKSDSQPSSYPDSVYVELKREELLNRVAAGWYAAGQWH